MKNPDFSGNSRVHVWSPLREQAATSEKQREKIREGTRKRDERQNTGGKE